MSATKTPYVILASGRGSNFSAIVAYERKNPGFPGKVQGLVCDRKEAPVLNEATRLAVPSVVIGAFGGASAGERGADRSAERSEALTRAVNELGARWAVLAGYMRLVDKSFLNAFRDERGFYRVVNIHPSLLPAFPGLEGYRQAFEHGSKLAGVTVHLVDEGLDSGLICAQRSFDISSCRSVDEVEALGLEIEHEVFPETLAWLFEEKFRIESRKGERKVLVRSR